MQNDERRESLPCVFRVGGVDSDGNLSFWMKYRDTFLLDLYVFNYTKSSVRVSEPLVAETSLTRAFIHSLHSLSHQLVEHIPT